MLKLKEELVGILNAGKPQKSVEAEAQLILYHFFREQTKTPGNARVTPEIHAAAIGIAHQRATGIPLQHLLGYQFFFEHEYQVNSSVLIPRPETEILVQAAITWAQSNRALRFAELGLGSGAISGEILFACPELTGVASEVSSAAADVARKNLESVLGSKWEQRLKLLLPQDRKTAFADFLSDGPYDLVVSNPPYVSREDEIEDEVLMHEPHLALFPDAENVDLNPDFFYENFLSHANKLMSPEGAAFFEVPHERADSIAAVVQKHRFQAELIPDLTGRSRVLKVTF